MIVRNVDCENANCINFNIEFMTSSYEFKNVNELLHIVKNYRQDGNVIFGTLTYHSKSHPADEKGRGHGQVTRFRILHPM